MKPGRTHRMSHAILHRKRYRAGAHSGRTLRGAAMSDETRAVGDGTPVGRTTVGRTGVDEQVIKDMLWAFAMRSPEHAALLVGAEGNITWTNSGAEVILGAAPGELVGRDVS